MPMLAGATWSSVPGLRHPCATICPMSEEQTFSKNERVLFFVQAALFSADAGIEQMNRLMELAAAEDRLHARPASLRQMGRDLAGEHPPGFIERLEKTVDASRQKALDHARQPTAGSDQKAGTTSGRLRQPLAVEQAIALLAIDAGPTALAEFTAELIAVIGDESDAVLYTQAYLAWRSGPPATTLFATALLPAAISSFEEFLGALCRTKWSLDAVASGLPDGSGPGRFASDDDRVRHDIDQRVKAFLRGRPDEWRRTIIDETRLDVAEMGVDWEVVNEAVERRHVLSHSPGRAADHRYRERTRSALPLGTPLTCGESYFGEVLAALGKLGKALAVCWLARLLPSGSEPVRFAAPYILWALGAEDWKRARTMASVVIEGRTASDISPEVRVNFWMARRHWGEGVEGIRAEVEAWEAPGGDLEYRLAKAALLLDEAKSRVLAAEYGRAGVPRSICEWPLVTQLVKVYPSLAPLFRSRPTHPQPRAPHSGKRRSRRQR